MAPKNDGTVEIRSRRKDDVDPLCDLVRRVHANGAPIHEHVYAAPFGL
jgi:phage tail protein X